MKPLPLTFTGTGPQKGFEFKQLARNNRYAVYVKQKPHGTPTWEVIEIQKRKEWVIAGKTLPAKESFPSPEEWGVKGWSDMTFEDAMDRYNRLSLH